MKYLTTPQPLATATSVRSSGYAAHPFTLTAVERVEMKIKESTSRILVGIEGALLCLPVTALYLYGGLPGIYYFFMHSPKLNAILNLIAATVIIVALICAWRLLLTFVCSGHAKLQRVSSKWWVAPYATACLSLIAPIFVVITSTPSALGMFGWGLPMILPLAHLHLERKANRIQE